MLDPAYLKTLLSALGDGSYSGVENNELMDHIVGQTDEPIEFTDEGQKFKYHMDEAWSAGLARARDDSSDRHWGLTVGIDGYWSLSGACLVLTPLGGEVLEELKKPRGLERLKQALRTAGSVAGSEALRYSIATLLKAATS